MQEIDSILDDIVDSPLFVGIAKQDLGGMMKCLGSYVAHFEKGEYISFEHDLIHSVGFVLHGNVHMVQEDIWGNKSILSIVLPQQLFGETFAFGSDRLSAVSFFAASTADILFLPFDHMMRTCSHSCEFHHQLIENMVKMIADKNKSLMDKLEIVSKKTLREKILTYLSLQAQKQDKRYFEIPLSRVELANYLCADRSALTREMTRMREEGVLDYDKNVFHLL